MALDRPDYAREVRYSLTDAMRLAHGLGLDKGAQRQGGGVLICCPVHGDRTPSCSITPGPDGTLRFRCFGCDASGDALTLIAAVRGLETRDAGDFRQVLAEGAAIAGNLALEAEILDGVERAERPAVKAPEPTEERDYPPWDEVRELYNFGGSVADDAEASGYLVKRGIDPVLVAERNLARVISEPLPSWARYAGKSWLETGHRMIVRAFDDCGRIRSVRAIRTRDGDTPKRLPPAGHKAAGLVMLNVAAWQLLTQRARFSEIVIVEGEPDMLTVATTVTQPVFGLVSGSWTDELADRIPDRTGVYVLTHADDAGERYAAQVMSSLGTRCQYRRFSPQEALQ